MKRNLVLFFVIIVAILLLVNGTKRLLTFRTTTQKVEDAQERLVKLKEENKKLKEQLNYTQSDEFKEAEIRDKLGLAKEGEVVVVLPKEDRDQEPETRKVDTSPNYKKWWNLFFGG